MESQFNKSKVITLLDMSDFQWQVQSGGFSYALHERQQETAGWPESSEKTSPGDNGNDLATKTLTYHHFRTSRHQAPLYGPGNLICPRNLSGSMTLDGSLNEGEWTAKSLRNSFIPAKTITNLTRQRARALRIYGDYFTSLNAVAEVHKVYKALGKGATIDPNVISQKLYDVHWIKTMSVWNSVHTSREYEFACISCFDTGTVNLPPSKFENVIALSSGDSLYISSPLLCDPSDKVTASNIEHMIGNVGKHGLLLLVPPVPQVMTPELDNWRSIDHPLYEGQLEDTFRGTSLHLSFTDWSAPIDLGRGHRDAEAYVANLDAYAHTPSSTAATATQNATIGDFVDKEISCITNWDEFLERPDTPSVAMTHKNWLARLSIAVLASRRGDRVFVNDRFCIQCLEDLEAFDPALLAKVLFVV
ncbi:hypothetical protein ACJ73_03487 [Blastomyces percursus]|uniref:Uncharacterized protein n=1 Tax=Blastomyces percursus TaxID=1658174 RepID=A0A1J9R9D9_9EURO|nr:hypothetical protein ACJ73_03487 [Blastomyces percursus]